jgi:hypothetical protein
VGVLNRKLGKTLRGCVLFSCLTLGASVLVSCSGARLDPAQHERDQKHCGTNADCASGLCRNGRCG